MIIKIGNTSDDKRVLNKSFNGSDINVQLKQPCDILNPVFLLDYNSELVSSNYLYCSEFNRYYFINNINLMPGHRMEITCNVDVLMSYKDAIKNISSVVVRQEQSELSLISDTSIMVKNYSIIDTYQFPERFDTGFGNYVMQVVGG